MLAMHTLRAGLTLKPQIPSSHTPNPVFVNIINTLNIHPSIPYSTPKPLNPELTSTYCPSFTPNSRLLLVRCGSESQELELGWIADTMRSSSLY